MIQLIRSVFIALFITSIIPSALSSYQEDTLKLKKQLHHWENKLEEVKATRGQKRVKAARLNHAYAMVGCIREELKAIDKKVAKAARLLLPSTEERNILHVFSRDLQTHLFTFLTDDYVDFYNWARSAKGLLQIYNQKPEWQVTVRNLFKNTRRYFVLSVLESFRNAGTNESEVSDLLWGNTFEGYYEFTRAHGSLASLLKSGKMKGSLTNFFAQFVRHPNDGILRCNNYGVLQVPEMYNQVSWANVVNLQGNRLQQIPVRLTKDPFLSMMIASPRGVTKLHLANNCFTKAPVSIEYFDQLTFLDISFNLIEVFPEELLAVKKLETLWLYGNKLTCLPEEISLTALKDLNVSRNRISRLPASITTMGLTSFYCDENPLVLTQEQQEWIDRMREAALNKRRAAMPGQVD